VTDLKLQVTDLKLQVTDLKLQVTDLKLQVTDLKLQVTDLKLQEQDLKPQEQEIKAPGRRLFRAKGHFSPCKPEAQPAQGIAAESPDDEQGMRPNLLLSQSLPAEIQFFP
ncbi:MAG: hypothetical protein LBF62_01095, partial [Tannerellaceae bacterium]|nr:hypothetical protein [Tannerellaceae bacterium]